MLELKCLYLHVCYEFFKTIAVFLSKLSLASQIQFGLDKVFLQ